MSDLVKERGATKWFRPSDYGANTGAKHLDKRRVEPRDPGEYRRDYEERRRERRYPNGRPGEPGYKPRNPRVPKPPVDAKPSPFRGRVPVPFGRAIERGLADPRTRGQLIRTFGRTLGRANQYWNAFENASMLIDALWPDPWQRPNVDPRWSLCRDCNKAPPYSVTVFQTTARINDTPPCFGQSSNCLDAQNGSDAKPLGAVMPASSTGFYIAGARRNTAGIEVYDNKLRYARGRSSLAQDHIAVMPRLQWVDLAIGPMPNPNAQRQELAMPAFPPSPPAAPPAAPPPPYMGVEFTPGRIRTVEPGRRRPPGKREKHNKNMGARATAVALFNALDGISESAEVIDALYQALPKSVRSKWDRKGRGLIDGAGQYGIDGADWKLQALWYNWSKIDAEQAVKNLINNGIQDKVHGGLHKHLPKNTGHALDPAFKGIEKGLGEFVYL